MKKSFKKIEEMNYYEILNVRPSASQQDIQKAYEIGKSAYHISSIAHYSLIKEEERRFMSDKIEEAFQTLGNEDQREKYDIAVRMNLSDLQANTFFRSTIQKMIIEDGDEKYGLWKKIRELFSSKKN